MSISYKSVYHLLDTYYLRRSLNGLINSSSIFSASTTFASLNEDYAFLEVMIEKRDYYNDNYVFFVSNKPSDAPIVLAANKDLNVIELAILAIKTKGVIPVRLFRELIVSLSTYDSSIDVKAELDCFNIFYSTNSLH